tara:strand:- start:2664 stop:2861 length:198 start_codon:yes stop_codon:yes gene_type:complete
MEDWEISEEQEARRASPDTEQTTAAQLLFHLQWMGLMWQCGREEEGNESYRKAQKLAHKLVAQGH